MSLDEVNQDLAGRFAAETGVQIDFIGLSGQAPREGTAAVICDLDHLPPGIVEKLESGWTEGTVVVHSYGLSVREIRAMRRRGVIVARRLTARLFARLPGAVGARRVALSPTFA